ncbi:division plane positioning ATPase MipZ [Sphingomonas sp. ID0503]|uniref:nucleotide-binding protein n=1 Tax=Sphingomonas sp. ID0503 TaxID=3399691 RepID=UPI003AFB41F8
MTKEHLTSTSKNAIAFAIVVSADKGGVGKSTTARIIAALIIMYGLKLLGFDCDARNAHLERYYGASSRVVRTQLRREGGWDLVFDEIENTPNATVLFDLPANVGDVIERQINKLHRVFEVLGRELIHVWVIDDEEDSVTLLNRVRTLAAPSRTLVVMNGRFGASPRDFKLWQESPLRAEMIAQGLTEIYLPVLPIRARTRIARSRSPFHDVSNAGLQAWERVDFDMWWTAVERAFSPFISMLEECK